MNKIIIRTALITVAAVVVLAAAVFSLWLVCSPSTMADACERTGNYPLAITCADLSYKYGKNIDDLARCAENSVRSGRDELIISYGEKLTADEKFEELCARRDKLISDTEYGSYAYGYKSYICGNLAAAQYRAGDLNKAVKTAGSASSFTKLVIEVITSGSKEDAETVLEALPDSETDLAELLKKFINQ